MSGSASSSKTSAGARWPWRWLLAAVAFALVGATSYAFVRSRTAAPATWGYGKTGSTDGLPELFAVPAFQFRDQRGQDFGSSALRGHVWIADFFFTTCGSVCPLLTAKLVLVQRKLPERALRFVSFSVDPTHDTEAALARYAAQWAPDEARWQLARTDSAGLASLAQGMHVAVEPSSDVKSPILHSSLFFLVDARGQVRGLYDSGDAAALSALERDTRELLGGTRAAAAAPARSGAELFAELGCAGCHSRPDVAPQLGGLFGSSVPLEGGHTVPADESYLRESLLNPGRQLRAGYLNLMPSYADELSPPELASLIGYVRGLPAPGTAQGVAASDTAQGVALSDTAQGVAASDTAQGVAASDTAQGVAASDTAVASPNSSVSAWAQGEPAPQVPRIDPVCGMTVRVAPTTPHVEHDGHDYYFCSERCRSSFLADPEHYLAGR